MKKGVQPTAGIRQIEPPRKTARKTEMILIGTVLASLAFDLENTVEQDWLT